MSEGPPARPMKYPYTYSAKLAQFPYKFHINNQWFYRYYIFGFAATIPVFLYFQKLCKYSITMKAACEYRHYTFYRVFFLIFQLIRLLTSLNSQRRKGRKPKNSLMDIKLHHYLVNLTFQNTISMFSAILKYTHFSC